MSVVACIVSRRGTRIPMTDEALLWAGRAAARETSTAIGWTAVLDSWAGRAVWLKERNFTVAPCREQPNRPLTFLWVVRCHSQPVNAYWVNRGTEGQIRVRSYLQSPQATWKALETGRLPDGTRTPMQANPGLRDHVYRWARGQIPRRIPSRYVDFSAPGMADVPSGALTIGGNSFFTEPGSAPVGTVNWVDDYVHNEAARNGGGSSLVGPILGSVLAVGLGAVGIAILRRRQPGDPWAWS